jgi:hypothetical protein
VKGPRYDTTDCRNRHVRNIGCWRQQEIVGRTNAKLTTLVVTPAADTPSDTTYTAIASRRNRGDIIRQVRDGGCWYGREVRGVARS